MSLARATFCLISLLVLAQVFGQTTTRLTDGWMPYEKGYTTHAGQGKTGDVALVCENTAAENVRGALNTVNLNQTVATAFLVSAWSKAEGVNGSSDDGYSLYLDLTYRDGDHLWGSMSPFATGTHTWQQAKVRIVPTKPVLSVNIYVLFRRHIGKAWFSDVTVSNLSGKAIFDFQPITAPQVLHDGWFVRDVAQDSPLVPVSDIAKLGLRAEVATKGDEQSIHVFDKQGKDRALTLTYCERFDAVGGKWWNTIRSSTTITDFEIGTLTSTSSGANKLSSLYPFAVVTTASVGRMLAVRPTLGPRPFRLFYNPAYKLLCASFDVGLAASNHLFPSQASAEVFLHQIDRQHGMRGAAALYYIKFPNEFKNRMPKQGIWIPFTNPSTISHFEDFGISVHEGDNSVSSDAKAGIYSFRYTEPMTWWMNMAPAIPRTDAAALEQLQKNRKSADPAIRRQAEAVVNSGTYGADGRYNVSFQNQPWANGAVWILNPNPLLHRTDGSAVQADVLFDLTAATKRFTTTSLSGEYLDSLESHSEVLDFRKESIAASRVGLSFDNATYRPVVPQAFSTFEIASEMSGWLHAKGKFLMANTTPINYFCYMPLVDCAGIEVNWLSDGKWTPDSDDVFCYRRTMSYHKPYMLLQNTDFSKFGSKEVALYFKKCVFYGVFPSFFSADAATNPYWENPALYNRDRDLFKRTIPVIQTLAREGWEPITNAISDDSAVFVERFGEHTWTVFNDSQVTKTYRLRINTVTNISSIHDLLSGTSMLVNTSGGKTVVTDTIEPGDCRVIRLSSN